MDFTDLISTVGFPIACVVALGGFCYWIIKVVIDTNKADKDKLYTALAESNTTNAKLLDANEKLLATIELITNELKQEMTLIGRDVEKIRDTVLK